ncbi:MFS transporter [Streptomyces sp. NPDC048257]|uniref:MFS transporter n=1 Tax=Streptomyces sp. NPDC048257 TaxID=3365526 RepID=UPI0037150316
MRRAVATGGLWYFAFNLTWVALTLTLAEPPHSLGPTTIGPYGLAGLLGFAVLPVTGRLADRYGPRTLITGALLAAAAGAALLATGLNTPPVVAFGLALFDAGCFAAQAANQGRIIALDPERSGSLSSVYLVLYFATGAIGTSLARTPARQPRLAGHHPDGPRCAPPRCRPRTHRRPTDTPSSGVLRSADGAADGLVPVGVAAAYRRSARMPELPAAEQPLGSRHVYRFRFHVLLLWRAPCRTPHELLDHGS